MGRKANSGMLQCSAAQPVRRRGCPARGADHGAPTMVMLALVTFAKVGRHDTVPENRIPWRRAWLSAPLSDAPPGGAPPGGRLAYWSPSIDRRGDATTSRRRRDHSHPARQYIRKAWWTWRERRRAIPPATGWTVSPERVIQASDCATSLDFRLFASIAARSAVQPAPSRLRRTPSRLESVDGDSVSKATGRGYFRGGAGCRTPPPVTPAATTGRNVPQA